MSQIPESTAAYADSAAPNWSATDLITRIIALFRTWAIRSRDRIQLLELDDHMLADIGLTRREVERFANQPFWRA